MDARGAGGLLHLRVGGPGAAVGDVVFDGVVEQHGVLRHDADGTAHAGLGHILHVLPVDRDAALLHIVEAEQQARQGRLASPRRADHGHRLAGGDLETHVLQDRSAGDSARAAGVVGKVHVLEAHRGRSVDLQWLGARPVGDLALLLHQAEHLVQVGQALLDLAVEHPQETQRDVELDHEGVDHHQVAQRHAALDHSQRGAVEHGHQADGNDQLLPGIEQAQRALALEGGAAVALQALVIALGLELLVVEVLDGLVVQQRVDGAAVCGRVQLVHLAAELGAPFGHGHGERDVEHQRDDGDPGKPDIELHRQQGQHQRDLDQRGDDAVERIRDQRMHAARAAFDVARHAAGLALQVKAQAQCVQMPEHFQRDAAGSAFGGLGEDQFAQLGKQRGGQAQQPVGDDQRHRHHQHRLQHCRGALDRVAPAVRAHGVDQCLEQQGHAHIGHLGGHHEGQRREHAPLVLPQVGEQAFERGPV